MELVGHDDPVDYVMWPYPRVLAHRGGGSLAPENTVAALRCGLAHGYAAVEFDVMLSKDNVPVLMHDPVFGRTVAGPGRVAATLAADLLKMDAGSWFDPAYAGETVPAYEQVVQFCRAHGIWMNVEIKPSPGTEAKTGRIVAETTRALFADIVPDATDRRAELPLLSSFSYAALQAAQQAAPEIARGLLMTRVRPGWQARLRDLAAVALHTNHATLDAGTARKVKDAGYGLFCYTVNSPERAREISAWGVDGFCTDRIDLISPSF